MKTQVKAVWAILVMLTIWCVVNSANINNKCSQEEIDVVTERLLQQAIDNESLSGVEQQEEAYEPQTFKEAFSTAREEQGEGGIFTWRDDEYTTDYAEKSTYVFPSDDIIGSYVRNSDDWDDYCSTNDRDVCGICGGNGAETWYADRDADGLGDINTSVVSCEQPEWGFHSK